MDLSMLVVDDSLELDRILESTNLEEYELIDLPMEQPDDSLLKHTSVRMAHTLDTGSTLRLEPCEPSSTVTVFES